MKSIDLAIPRPKDLYEKELYMSTKLSIDGLGNDVDDSTRNSLTERFWNIYFWNIFQYRAHRTNCADYIIKISKPAERKIHKRISKKITK